MAVQNKTYLDLAGLTSYDGKIKQWSNSISQAGIKTVLKTADGNTLKFYKKPNASLSDQDDFSIDLGSADAATKLTALATTMGATWNSSTGTYDLTGLDESISSSATTVVGAINEVISDFNTIIGNIPTGYNTVVGYAAGIAASEADDAENAAKDYTDTELGKLDADLDASGTAAHGGTFVVSGVTQADGKITGIDSVEVETAGSAAAAVEALDVAEFALASESSNVITIKGIKEVDGKIAVGTDTTKDITLGTAAKANIATSPIAEESTDNSLVSAAQVATFVAAEVADLEGAMHFAGVITRGTGETDAEAIARVITSPEAGDVVVMSDNAKEYIYVNSTVGWREVGDEGLYVQKTTTIAGVDLQDNITQSELQTALGLGSAAYEATTAFDAAGTAAAAVAALDTTESQTAGTDGLALSITQTDGVITAISGSIAANTYDAYGAANAAVAALDGTATIASYVAGSGGAADVITIKGGITEADGVVDNSAADDITLSTITTAQINNLFS